MLIRTTNEYVHRDLILGSIKYADIGKSALDILSKNYPSDVLTLEVNGTETSVYL